MLRFKKICAGIPAIYSSVTLTFDQRVKSRLKVKLDNGEPAGLFLARGTVLQHGNKLQAETGEVIEVRAAGEAVSTLYVDNPVLMARACYHLGNRHVPLQIARGFIRYQHDHVLDAMVKGLNLEVVLETATFEPEAGAYGKHSHAQSDEHGHDHDR